MYKKILIIKPSSLGDIIHSLPFLNTIKKEFPQARIHWLVAKGFEEILMGHPYIEKIHIIDKDRWKKPIFLFNNIKDILDLSGHLKREDYDAVVDLQGLFRSGLIAWLSGSPVRIGFSDAREFSYLFYNRTLEGGNGIHAVERYLKLVRLLGINSSDIAFPFPPFNPSPIKERYYVVVPGARWLSKQWPVEYFIEIINMLGSSGLVPVIVGSKEEVSLSEIIVSKSIVKCVNLAGKTDLKELCSVLKEAEFIVTNDSGPMHIAAALGVKVFALFGPTDERLTGPYGENSVVIKADNIKCSPCRNRVCSTMKCLYDLKPEEVFKIISDHRI